MNQQGDGRQNSRHKKVKTGRFAFMHGFVHGIIVRDGPTTRYSLAGNAYTEATLLVGLYDGRQKAERETPEFVELIAFGELGKCLAGYERRDHVHAAGRLNMEVWEDRNGNVRNRFKLIADRIQQEPFPQLTDLLPDSSDAPNGETVKRAPTGDETVDHAPAWEDDSAATAQPAHQTADYDDDIPF